MIKNHIGVFVEKNALVDEGDGVIKVEGGLTLTDDQTQHNGTKYDVKSLDVSEYDGRLFADHGDGFNGYTIEKVIGKLLNVRKVGKRVVADGIHYAINANPLALYAYNMTKEGWLRDFSIGTQGDSPDEDGIYKNHSLYETSQVGIGNNQRAKINVAVNSIEQAKQQGMDTSELEKWLEVPRKETKVSKKVKNEVETKVETKEKTEEPKSSFDMEALETAINKAVEGATKPLADKLAKVEKNAFDKAAKEPEFKSEGVKNKIAKNWEDRTVQQIEAARQLLRSSGANQDAAKTLYEINSHNLTELKKEGLIKNQVTLDSFDNFVISPEQLSEIEGCRNDYTPLKNLVSWRETLSIDMTWLSRQGDIEMEDVEFCDDDEDGNLKPVSSYGAELQTSKLHEAAAVTPVCNAATRFMAVDVLGDVNDGYRTAYDRSLARLVVGRLQQAVNSNGNSVAYDTTSDVDALKAYIRTWAEVANCTPNGTFVLSNRTYAELLERALGAGVNGPLAQLFTTGAQNTIFGRPYVLVTDDLLPTLGTNETRSFSVAGDNVEINQAVFYFNPSNFAGRISGGLNYDLSTSAAYEVPGDGGTVVRSAWQRNELVLRGSFFRGGAVKDVEQVASVATGAVS